jgi:hypothetical protein
MRVTATLTLTSFARLSAIHTPLRPAVCRYSLLPPTSTPEKEVVRNVKLHHVCIIRNACQLNSEGDHMLFKLIESCLQRQNSVTRYSAL